MATVNFEGIACSDCACMIANADDSGVHESDRAAWEQGIEDTKAHEHGYAVISCSGEESEECDNAREDTCTHCGRMVWGYFHAVAYLS